MNKQQANRVLKQIRQRIHPDKVHANYSAECEVLFKNASELFNSGRYDELNDLWVLIQQTDYTQTRGTTMTINEQLVQMKADGKTRKQAKGWLLFEHDIDGKSATTHLDEVYSRSSGANKADIVAHIITGKSAGMTNAQIAESLCEEFNWAPSTGKTVISHLSYMIEYARQTNV